MYDTILNQFEIYLVTQKRFSHNTVYSYRKDIEQYTKFFAEKKIPLQNTTKKEILLFLRWLKVKAFSTRSIARKIASLRLFYVFTADRYNWHNSAKNICTPKIEKKLPRYLTEKEVQILLDRAGKEASLVGRRNFFILYLLYITGMRITELTQLTIDDIQFDTGFIRITGKGSKQRLVPLPLDALSLMKEYLATVRSTLLKKYRSLYLFPIIYGGTTKPISRQACWFILKQLCIKAGMDSKGISPHQLRHSLATHLLKQGANLRSLQLWLGHEQVSTVELYTHVEIDHIRKLYDKKHPRS